MKRYQRFFGPILLALCVWTAGLRYCGIAGHCARQFRDVLEIQPLYWLMVFGCFALAKIGLGLIAFKDCSEDAANLDRDIQMARADLIKRGFTFSGQR